MQQECYNTIQYNSRLLKSGFNLIDDSSILTKIYGLQQCESNSFIYSFIRAISTAPLPSPQILRSALDTVRILCQSLTPKLHRQLRVKDLPKVPTWRLERDSIPGPFGRNASDEM